LLNINLAENCNSFFRFGFRLNDDDNEESSLEEKAEKMRKQAQDQHQVATEATVSFLLITVKRGYFELGC
jgi:hypothetical protein